MILNTEAIPIRNIGRNNKHFILTSWLSFSNRPSSSSLRFRKAAACDSWWWWLCVWRLWNTNWISNCKVCKRIQIEREKWQCHLQPKRILIPVKFVLTASDKRTLDCCCKRSETNTRIRSLVRIRWISEFVLYVRNLAVIVEDLVGDPRPFFSITRAKWPEGIWTCEFRRMVANKCTCSRPW